jgi:isoquinoline 1-oxidoreductase alpha subunit
MPALNVNGKAVQYQADPGTPLLWVLREQLGLTGTKYGCGVAQCGACTVLINGQAVRSCVRPAASVKATERIVTIEGLARNGKATAVQKAWADLDVPQCGFCQSGMIMAATALLAAKPNPGDADIDAAMTNICRCGTYNRVRAAIKVVANGGDAKAAGLDIEHVRKAAGPGTQEAA